MKLLWFFTGAIQEDSDTESEPKQSKGSLDESNAEKLDMDHVFIPFGAFLWARTFVGINAVVLMLGGTLKLIIRKKLYQCNIIKPKPFVPEELVANLLLEGIGYSN